MADTSSPFGDAFAITVTEDPSSTAVNVPKGSVIVYDNKLAPPDDVLQCFLKMDDGATTNVSRMFPPRLYEAMSTVMLTHDDFLMPSSVGHTDSVQVIAAGLGAGIAGAGLLDKSNHPGVWTMVTGSAAAGRVFIIGTPTNGFHYGRGGIVRHGFWVRTGAYLADVTDAYVLRAGTFSIVLPNTILEGIGFEYQHDENGGNWQGITVATGESMLDTGVLVEVDTWYLLECECNQDGTSVEFFIDGVSVGTLAIAANIPSGTVIDNFVNAHIMKLAGASRAFSIDAYYLHQELKR